MGEQLGTMPDIASLAAGLGALLQSSGSVTVLDRRPDDHRASFPNEIVRCRLGDRRELKLFCKYAAPCVAVSHGHKAGVDYEATVYREILERVPQPTPRFYGIWQESEQELWLVLEYLEDSVWIDMAPNGDAMGVAAAWIGRFHAGAEQTLPRAVDAGLRVYDEAYYSGWVRRTVRFAGSGFPWLEPLSSRFDCLLPLLLEPQTVIHGEYYKKNVLFRDGVVYPVDWESAAIGAGEIDLAALTEGRRPSEIIERCETEYGAARWPAGAPRDFCRRLDAARLYLQFRWLGDRAAWTTHERSRWRFDALRTLGERLELI